jgi:hypothetical protein
LQPPSNELVATYKSHLRGLGKWDKSREIADENPCQGRVFRGARNMVEDSHGLQELFIELVGRHYEQEIGLRDPQIVNYVAQLLAEFCDVQQLYKIRNATGRGLSDVGEMLMESDPVYGPAPSFDRERQVRKHIGDYTLFFTGMFPESINHIRLRRDRMENFVDWMKAGKESYYIVSKFEHFEYAKVAPLFASLSNHFEQCVYGLNRVKNDLQEMQHPIIGRSNELLM